MAWTVDTFVAAYPEFAEERRDTVTAKLAEAVRRVNATVWGAMQDDGVALLAAHLLEMNARPYRDADGNWHTTLVRPDGQTQYLQEFKRIERLVGLAHRVIPHEDEDTD